MEELGRPKNWRDAYKDLSIIAHFKRTREAMDMSMAELARRSGLPVQRINDFEKKKRRPSIEQFYRWGDALEMDTPSMLIAYMMETLKEANIDTTEMQRLLDNKTDHA